MPAVEFICVFLASVALAGLPGLDRSPRKALVEAIIKSAVGRRQLRFHEINGDYFRVTVEGDGPEVTKGIYAYTDSSGLADLFESCAKDWTGWTDDRFWESIEGDLRLEIYSSRTGQVTIKVRIRDTGGADDWDVRVPIFTEAGALEDISRQSRIFFGS